MHAKFLLWIAFAGSLALTGAGAQDLKQIPPPTKPFVLPVPENADWVITLQSPAEPPKPPPTPGAIATVDRRIKEIHSTKFGKFKREITSNLNGSTDERWYVGNYYLWTPPNQDVSVFDMGAVDRGPNDISPTGSGAGFAGVGWTTLKNYDKVVVYEGVPCYHYAEAALGTEAWINVQTRLPVAYKDADVTYRYKFNAAPTELPTMPPPFQKAWTRCKLILNLRD